MGLIYMNDKMPRVNKYRPCPICGKPDWCLVSEDGSAAICQRIQEGSIKSCGDAGYLHILVDRPKDKQHRLQRKFTVRLNDRPDRDFKALQQQYSRQITSQQLNDLSERLGVSTQSLKRLRVGWDGGAYTFPMSYSNGAIIGIRRRFPNGYKCSVASSRTGLFIPSKLSGNEPLLLAEGPTDTAAALDLGFDAIGRPNCNSKVEMTVKAARGREEIVIIGDNDSAGKNGAEKLAEALVLYYPSVKIIYPPDGTKDLRQWLQAGLKAEKLQAIINNTEPIKIEINRSMETEGQ